MTTNFSKLLAALTGVGILSAAVSPIAGGEQISIASSRAVRPLMQQAVEEFGNDFPNVRFVVGSGRSDNAVASVGKDEVQIGLISRDLTDSEKATYRHLRPVRIAIDGVGLIVHPLNSVCDLSTEQVCSIFTGRITNWTEVGGTDAPIVLFSVNRHHGTFDLFCEHFAMTANEQGDQIVFQEDEASDHATATARIVYGNRAALAAVMIQPNGIAYGSLGAMLAMTSRGAPAKILKLDGVVPSEENIVADDAAPHSYTLRRPLLLLTNGQPSGAVVDFLNFLASDRGRRIVEQQGFIPIR